MSADERPEGRESSPSRLSLPPRGSHRTVLFLLAGGAALLIAAAAIYLARRPAAEPPAIPAPADDAIYAAPRLLVTAPPRPLSERVVDAGAPDARPGEKRGRGAERLGTVDADAVNRLMNERFGQVRGCYERRLKMKPTLEGDLDLRITISTSGRARAIGVTADTVRDPEMLECVRRTIRSWPFPKAKGGDAVVAKNLRFKRKS